MHGLEPLSIVDTKQEAEAGQRYSSMISDADRFGGTAWDKAS
jgi:hypothetical protein